MTSISQRSSNCGSGVNNGITQERATNENTSAFPQNRNLWNRGQETCIVTNLSNPDEHASWRAVYYREIKLLVHLIDVCEQFMEIIIDSCGRP